MIRKIVLPLFLIPVLFIPLSIAHGQQPAPEALLYLQAATFDPLVQGEPALAVDATVQAAAATIPASPYFIVQFTGPVDATSVAQIEALGGAVFGYVPENAHIVRMTPDVAAKVDQLPSVRWIGAYRPGYKLGDELAQNLGVLAAADRELELTVIGFGGESLEALRSFLQQQGATILDAGDPGTGPIFTIRAPAHALTAIVQHPAVSWIDRYIEPTLYNAKGRKIMGVEAVWQDFGFFGEGQIIAISDSGLSVQGALSQDFGNRLIRAFSPSEMNIRADCRSKTNFTDLHGHGTHVAGSVLGAGVLSGSNVANHLYTNSHAGTAPEARLVFMALNTDGSSGIQCIDVNGDYIAKGYELGARISSNSWGSNDAGGYGDKSSVVDNYIWNHKDYLVLYAAGNAGPGNQTVGSPGTAKNILTVGATENNRPDRGAIADDPDEVASFSSRGPTTDNRLKPDVVAPGTFILSVRAAQAPNDSFWEPFDQNYAYMGGTSMATPLTAGSAALVREWLGKVRGIPNPSAALMKAVMINGATQLPGAPTLNINSGHGRVDLKNTLNAQYAIMDDHVQGMATGDSFEYSINVVANTATGTLFAADGHSFSPQTVATDTVQAAAAETMQLTDLPPAAVTRQDAGPTDFTVEALPGHTTPRQTDPITKAVDLNKEGDTPVVNAVPALPRTPTAADAENATAFHSGLLPDRINSFQFNIVGGGDFEEPWWSLLWSYVWLGQGIPEIIDDPDYVINGEQSMWLGGHAGEDSIWYPVHFPDQIDTQFASGIEFNLSIVDADGGDTFCVALTDVSGYFIGPYAPNNPDCANTDGLYTYSKAFTAAELQTLHGQTGYLVLYTLSDGVRPNMSALIDDVALYYDLPDVETTVVPQSGPPGTTFLVVSKYNAPYSEVSICACSDLNDSRNSAYADAQGNVAIFLYSSADTAPGTYEVTTVDFFDRSDTATLTIGDGANAELTVAPESGPAGTEFRFNGSNFVPNDAAIAVTVNGESFGTVGSNESGQVNFTLTTRSNTPAGEYTIRLTDKAGRSATVAFTLTAVGEDDPSLTVTPASGPQGTSFVFRATNFTPAVTASVLLDGQAVGEATPDAAGALELTLNTTADVAPGTYTLSIQQGTNQASAQFVITQSGGGGDPGTPQSGNGLYITLVWTDPPAQAFAAKTLVNNLDLSVRTPSGDTILGNGATGQADNTNNVETVRLEAPEPGTYVVTVQATSVNGSFGSQPYALVATTKQNFETHIANVDLDGDGVQPTPTPIITQTLGSLSGVVYVDLNRNGKQDSGEAGIANARVLITPVAGGATTQTTTDATGKYTVRDLVVGEYRVQVVVPGFAFTTNNSFVQEVDGVTTATIDVGVIAEILLPLIQR